MPLLLKDKERAIEIRRVGTRIQVSSPYNEEWVVEAHELNGRWRKRSRVWSFLGTKYVPIVQELNRIYRTQFPLKPPLDGRTRDAKMMAANDQEEL